MSDSTRQQTFDPDTMERIIPDALTRRGGAAGVSFRDEQGFDTIVSLQTFEHVPNAAAIPSAAVDGLNDKYLSVICQKT